MGCCSVGGAGRVLFVVEQRGVALFSVDPADLLHVLIYGVQQRTIRRVEYAGAAGRAEPAGDGGHPGRNAPARQRPAGDQGGDVGMKGRYVSVHFFSVSRKSSPSGFTST